MGDFNVKNTFDKRKILSVAQSDVIQVGFVAGMPHANADEDIAELAKKLSFGDSKIPARPFLEEGMNEGIDQIKTAIGQHLKGLMDAPKTGSMSGFNAAISSDRRKKGLNKIGAIAVGAIKKFVYGDYYRENVPNAEMTIELKGSDKPLIDTGQMINSLTYVVNGKKE